MRSMRRSAVFHFMANLGWEMGSIVCRRITPRRWTEARLTASALEARTDLLPPSLARVLTIGLPRQLLLPHNEVQQDADGGHEVPGELFQHAAVCEYVHTRLEQLVLALSREEAERDVHQIERGLDVRKWRVQSDILCPGAALSWVRRTAMAQSRCPKCLKTECELKESTPVGSRYKLWMVQCAAWRASVGNNEFVSVGSMVANLEKDVKRLSGEVNALASAVYSQRSAGEAIDEGMATIEKAAHSERGAILRFFLKHPMVGPIGSAASVISLLGVEMGSGF